MRATIGHVAVIDGDYGQDRQRMNDSFLLNSLDLHFYEPRCWSRYYYFFPFFPFSSLVHCHDLMIFRGLQLTTTANTTTAVTDHIQKRRPLAPALLDDPAFSPDPHSHPDFVTDHEPEWLFPPPGHPTILKSKNRFINSFQTNDDQGDTITTHQQQLIQPPNSPATVADPEENPHFPFKLQATATSSLTAIKRNPFSFQTESQSLVTSLPPPSTPQRPSEPAAISHPQPKLPKFNKRFMPFLSRRKSAKPKLLSESQSTTPFTVNSSQLASTKTGSTAPSLSSPAVAQQAPGNVDVPLPPIPSHHDGQKPDVSGRSVNTPGKNTSTTSRKSSVAGSAASKRLPNGLGARLSDLDRIDELDNSNPWGVSLHHGGPYEAAVKAIRRGAKTGERKIPLGIQGHGHMHDYHRRAMEAHGNMYIPPRAPIGVSLNLSPGQVLPRNLSAPEGIVLGMPRRDNPPQPVMMMRRKPSTSVIPETPITAFSPPPPSQILPPLPPPQPVPQITLRHETPPQPAQRPQRPPDVEMPPDDTARIGLAMFSEEPEPSPRSATHPTESDNYDPYDPIHLEASHSRSRTPSPFINNNTLSAPVSRALTPEPAQSAIIGHDGSTSDLTLIGSTADDRSHPSTPNPPPQISLPGPPPYTNSVGPATPLPNVSSTPSPPQTRDGNSIPPSLVPSMGRQSGLPIVVHPFDANQRSTEDPRPLLERRLADSSSRGPSPHGNASRAPPQQPPSVLQDQHQPQQLQGDVYNQPPPPRPIPREVYTQAKPPTQESQYTSYIRQPQQQREDLQIQNHAPSAQQPMLREVHTQYTPPNQEGQQGSSRGRGPPPSSSEIERDARSMHPSISTQASSMQRYGPPRHHPKHLVMPAPLNTASSGHPSHNQLPPPAPFVRGHYQRRSRQMTVPAPLAPRGAGPMRPIAAPMTPIMPIMPRAQEVQMNNGRGGKLKKRVSLFGSSKQAPPPPQKAPVLTTVSFAPPIIAFERRGEEKMLLRANTERLPPASGPKRFLSKRQSNV
ncbi:hypothetical protein BJ165DRAFT_535249 [Panaeolus papilionaceus]|nr:hypothetical protein BJ165DRAFT_535249 [Panaeolus papilionaceus]